MNDTIKVTEAKHLFMGDGLVHPDYTLYRVDGGDVRWYFCPDDDTYYPSVTSVIGATTPTPYGLLVWMKKHGENADAMRDERAAYGTALHNLVERMLLGMSVTGADIANSMKAIELETGPKPQAQLAAFSRELRKDLLSFVQFAQDVSLEPVAVEIMLRGDGYAGAADIVGYVNGELSIVDIKSGKKGFYESHEIQLHMYKAAWDELYPDLPIQKVYNFSPKDWRKKPTYTLKDQTKSTSAAKIPLLLKLFSMSDHKPPTLLDFDGAINLDSNVESLYEFTDIKSRVSH